MTKMEGLYPILAMPFDQNGNIDLEDLESEVEYGIDEGVDGIGLAFGSEIVKLTDAERNIVTKTIVTQAKNRVPIVINTGAHSTFAAVEYSKQAEKDGADAIMCLPPPGLPSKAIENYFSEIDSNVGIPIFIQDAGNSPIPEHLGKLLSEKCTNISYAKIETQPPATRVKNWIDSCGETMSIFGGASGTFILEELSSGSKGTMPHFGYIPMFRKVIDLFKNNLLFEAEQEFNKYASVFRSDLPQLYMTKEILKRKGVFKNSYMREPTSPPNKNSWDDFFGKYEKLLG